ELEEARKNIPSKNPVDVGKQLAAARGEYVEGISDPNDPKWVRDDYSASNKGEKTENQPSHNDDRSPEMEESAAEASATSGQTLEKIAHLLESNNRLMETLVRAWSREAQRRDDIADLLLLGMRGFIHALAARGNEKNGDKNEKLHRREKG
ncbi:hypothetical protein VQY59_004908, partial [Salmonella enterica]|nr:hypothetical protein [Salmonella enterica]